MKRLLTIWLIVTSILASGQSTPAFSKTIQSLFRAGAIPDSIIRMKEVMLRWAEVRAQGIPFVVDDSVAFFYQGEANSVTWMGDFNGWGSNKEFNNKGLRIPGSDIWMMRCSFPFDARLDYKILVNEKSWILDSENPHQQWSGVGGGSPNSELRMPGWKEDPILKTRTGIPRGTVKKDILYDSRILGYPINYNVYLPAGYEHFGKLPVIYVTDGNEYMMPELGNMITVLDNLIADKKIKPVIAVFIDHREPANRSNNRRMEELNMNEKYLRFFTEEFLRSIEGEYPIRSDAAHRAILGTSMGGLNAAYFTFTRPDLIGKAGIQSPAFWVRPEIYALCDSIKGRQIMVSITTGLVNDAGDASRKLKDILQKNSIMYRYRENSQGHSWGNWKSLIDDILIDFFGKQ